MATPQVSILCGSESDLEVVKKAEEVLEEAGVSFETRVLSAHRNPDELRDYVRGSGAMVFICLAGLSAALPGAVAALTEKPVIGVPLSVKLDGLDALLSISQMPRGVPVACVGIDAAENGALLAIRILGAGT